MKRFAKVLFVIFASVCGAVVLALGFIRWLEKELEEGFKDFCIDDFLEEDQNVVPEVMNYYDTEV